MAGGGTLSLPAISILSSVPRKRMVVFSARTPIPHFSCVRCWPVPQDNLLLHLRRLLSDPKERRRISKGGSARPDSACGSKAAIQAQGAKIPAKKEEGIPSSLLSQMRPIRQMLLQTQSLLRDGPGGVCTSILPLFPVIIIS